jgi:hypothetical protein
MVGPYAHGTCETDHSAPSTKGRQMKRRATVAMVVLVLAFTSFVHEDHSTKGEH